MTYSGNETFVKCAQEGKRYDICSQMMICVTGSTTDYEYVASHFISDFLLISSGLHYSIELYLEGACNVVASSRFDLLNCKQERGDVMDDTFIILDEIFNSDPLSYVTRPNDHEWSSIANWVVQSLFFGERRGITANESLCQNSTNINLNADWSELNFINAVYCVGNYAELYNDSEPSQYNRTAVNTINNGTAMVYVIPYGNLDNANDMFYDISKTYAKIKSRNRLNCGLLIQDGYNENDPIASNGLFGLGVRYCQSLASSMLDGNLYGVDFKVFETAKPLLVALNNGTVDVLLGIAADLSLNFGDENLDGVVFSLPYYYHGSQLEK